jgi:hypothetical protein
MIGRALQSLHDLFGDPSMPSKTEKTGAADVDGTEPSGENTKDLSTTTGPPTFPTSNGQPAEYGGMPASITVNEYVSAVKRFHQAVSELAAKLDNINSARDEALTASEKLRKELDVTDQQLREVSLELRQQITTVASNKKVA